MKIILCVAKISNSMYKTYLQKTRLNVISSKIELNSAKLSIIIILYDRP